MNLCRLPTRIAVGTLFVIHHPSFIQAQGPLTPPGPPAPTLRTLDQLESRTPISNAPFTITESGSYYLGGNLSVATGNAILINADEVTLDLNGFTIASTASPASGSGVSISGGRDGIVIRNGHIAGTTTVAGSTFTGGGFSSGVRAMGVSQNVRASELSVRGVDGSAIDLGSRGIVERCLVSVCNGRGIRAQLVRDCAVDLAGGTAIAADVVQTCFARSLAISPLVHSLQADGSVQNSRAFAEAGAAIATAAGIGSTGVSVTGPGVSGRALTNCVGASEVGPGLVGGQANNCLGTSINDSGLTAENATNSEGSSIVGTAGLKAFDTASFCRGKRDSSVALDARIAIGCTVTGTGTITSPQKHLGTP